MASRPTICTRWPCPTWRQSNFRRTCITHQRGTKCWPAGWPRAFCGSWRGNRPVSGKHPAGFSSRSIERSSVSACGNQITAIRSGACGGCSICPCYTDQRMPASTISVGELADERPVRECLQWFTREKQWINEIHLSLCRIPAPTFLEQQRAEWMAAQFRAMGCEASLDRAGNVVATLGPLSDGPYVALTAHLDTVLTPRTKEEITVEPDGRFRGPGVSDNGAGLAALLGVARALKSCQRLDEAFAKLVFIANVGEEGEGNLSGMRFLCKQSPLAKKFGAFLILDGATTDHITNRALGSRRFEVTFTGPGGHSWSDYGVGNPVHALSRAVALFSEVRLNGGPKSSINVGLIEGGTGINAIPAMARAKVDIRS